MPTNLRFSFLLNRVVQVLQLISSQVPDLLTGNDHDLGVGLRTIDTVIHRSSDQVKSAFQAHVNFKILLQMSQRILSILAFTLAHKSTFLNALPIALALKYVIIPEGSI